METGAVPLSNLATSHNRIEAANISMLPVASIILNGYQPAAKGASRFANAGVMVAGGV